MERFRNLPLSDPRPDADRFIAGLTGRTAQEKPPLVEFLVDDTVMKPILTDLLGRAWVESLGNREAERAYRWHKRFAALTHQKGLPYFLHSCGNLEKVMEDLITEVGIDGKHSFEDVIIPVHEFQERYGDRIACLGGLDVHILAASTPGQIRRQTRRLMEVCGARGRYAIGSGNSIPSYVPVDNYLAMVDEALASW